MGHITHMYSWGIAGWLLLLAHIKLLFRAALYVVQSVYPLLMVFWLVAISIVVSIVIAIKSLEDYTNYKKQNFSTHLVLENLYYAYTLSPP